MEHFYFLRDIFLVSPLILASAWLPKIISSTPPMGVIPLRKERLSLDRRILCALIPVKNINRKISKLLRIARDSTGMIYNKRRHPYEPR